MKTPCTELPKLEAKTPLCHFSNGRKRVLHAEVVTLQA